MEYVNTALQLCPVFTQVDNALTVVLFMKALLLKRCVQIHVLEVSYIL